MERWRTFSSARSTLASHASPFYWFEEPIAYDKLAGYTWLARDLKTPVQLEARGATGIIFGTSGYDVERELRAYAEVAALR